MAIKTPAQILASIFDNVVQGVDPADVRDAFDSLISVGGTMHATDVSVPISTDILPIINFEGVLSTKGVTADIAAGSFTVGEGGDGEYDVTAAICVESPINGNIQVAFRKNGVVTPYVCSIDVVAGKKTQFTVIGSGTLAEGDVVDLAWVGSASGNLPVASMQFRLKRS